MFTNIDDDSRSFDDRKLGGGYQKEHDLCFVYLIIHVFMTGLSAVYRGKGLRKYVYIMIMYTRSIIRDTFHWTSLSYDMALCHVEIMMSFPQFNGIKLFFLILLKNVSIAF